MERVQFSEFKKNIDACFTKVLASRVPLLVSHEAAEEVVVVAAGEYQSMQETMHLLSTSANSGRLRESVAQLREDDEMRPLE